ncbi:hypothetical protein SAMN05518871_109150 [Psychrobacillus sp. OK028]|uniref:hypothetical protein n=1 Tax=Psychrobacillus sp. OK028 TaxID=1884359 RepID=UPI00087F619A|nr:hypothetical protein [Psychrobacillus sp. OK028]SDO03105.1 hypothetical protein SAMN05518871_109150 [Psychrobacillus sp. OK028]
MISLKNIIDSINAIPWYSTPNELAKLSFQSKTEYLFRDKLDLYFSDRFSQGISNVFPIREWSSWKEWGIDPVHLELYVKEKGINIRSKDKETRKIEISKLPMEIKDLTFTYDLKGTQAIDLALFEYPKLKPKYGNPPFPLVSLLEFKCEVIYQLTPSLLKKKSYIEKDIQRMKKFQVLYDHITFFEILILVDFPHGINPMWYPLNTHFEEINNYQKKKPDALNEIKSFINQYFSKDLHIEYVTLSAGIYLNTPVTLHFWIFTNKET